MGKSNSRAESTSKSDLKLEKKVKFYSKVKDSVASLGVKKATGKKKIRSRQKKLKVYDLTTLSEFLPELKSPLQSTTAPPELKVNCKNRQQIIMKERKQLDTVLNHPAFQADPLGSIFQHLQGTQPVVEEKPKKKKPNVNGGRKRKQKKMKGLSKPQSMDM